MLYINRPLGLLLFSAQFSVALAGVTFDSQVSSLLPDNALIGVHGTGAAVEVVDKKLKFTTGSGGNSARVAVALPPEGAATSDEPREIKLVFEPFAGRQDNARAGVWLGFVSASAGAQNINTPGQNWVGIAVELKEHNKEGQYAVRLRQRWEANESEEPHLTSGVAGDAAITEVCVLTACPTGLEAQVTAGAVRITFENADVAVLGPMAMRAGGVKSVDVALEPQMAEILKGDLDPVFGLANYGHLQEAPVWLVNSFSVVP